MNKIKELRKKTKLSQSKFCTAMGNIPVQTLQQWESGRRNPPEYVIELIEKIVEQEF